MIHVKRNGQAADGSRGEVSVIVLARMEERDLRAGGRLSLSSSFLSGTGSFFSLATLLKSNAVPGVFGVLVALPKDAKAPLPRPKAEDAPEAVGDAVVVVVRLPSELNGLRPP